MNARHICAADFTNGDDLRENLMPGGGGSSFELENEQQ